MPMSSYVPPDSANGPAHDPLLCGLADDCPGCAAERAAGRGDAWEHPMDLLARDQEARQRHEDRELERDLCRLIGTTPDRLGRMLLRMLAPGIAEIADAGRDTP
jgi:hypothetical protein